MDHLPLPIDKHAHRSLQVPYLGSKNPLLYDDLGFLTFPQRAGVDINYICYGDYSYESLEAIAPFLQEWLWFGLLGEVLGIGSRGHIPQRIAGRGAFITEDENGIQTITTSKLYGFVMLASTKNQAPLFNEFHRTRFETSVRQALDVVIDILMKFSPEILGTRPDIYAILLSIQILGETLLSARHILFPNQRLHRLSISSFIPQQCTIIADMLLKRAGWCPSEIHGLPKEVILRFYFSFSNRLESSRDHGACDENDCQWSKTIESAIRPAHTSENCLCEEISVPKDEITRIIANDQGYLVTFSEFDGGKRRLGTQEFSFSGSRNFVAISHVRSKGLGNALSNSLLYCQLSLIQTLANDFFLPTEHPVPFWIDTLCLPRSKSARKQAFRRIRQLYLQASKVLVLDPYLYQYNVGSSQECLLRIKNCSWAKRLWTLQEGSLAQSLNFKFLNCVKNLEAVLIDYANSPGFPLLPRVVTSEGSIDMRKLSILLSLLDDDLKVANSIVAEKEVQDKLYDKDKLRTILRFGYLAFPQFYFLATEVEATKSRGVVDVLWKTYIEEQDKVVSSTEISMSEKVIERLKAVSRVNLALETE